MSTETVPFLTRDTLKALAEASKTAPRTIEFVDAPALGGQVGILKLHGFELDDLYAWVRRANKRRKRLNKKDLGFRAFVLARTIVDASGTRLLTDDDATAGWLDELPADICSVLVKTAFRLNGIGKEEEREEDEDEDGHPSASAPTPAPASTVAAPEPDVR